MKNWIKVVHADECLPCFGCGEPVCLQCGEHYARCDCPGPHQEDQYRYRLDSSGVLWAQPLGAKGCE